MTGPVALILGGSRAVWDDLAAAQQLTAGRDTIIVAVNFAGRTFEGDIDAWVTLHPDSLPGWRDERAGRGLNTDYRVFAHEQSGQLAADEVVPLAWSGSSGLYGAQVAVQAMGAVGAILCGVPLSAEAGHYAEPGDWTQPDGYRTGFAAALAAGLPVRSMSGWTRDQAGAPDAAWLDALGVGPASPQQCKPSEATMWVKFLRDHDYTPSEDGRATTAYKAGMQLSVRQECGLAAIAAGEAEEIKAPRRDPLDHDDNGRKGGVKSAKAKA